MKKANISALEDYVKKFFHETDFSERGNGVKKERCWEADWLMGKSSIIELCVGKFACDVDG